MSISKIKLENFTVFENTKIEFSNGINMLIGENGTGKTHLLKAIYALSEISKTKDIDDISLYFKSGNEDNTFFVNQLKPLLAKITVEGIENNEDKQYLMGKLYLNSNEISAVADSEGEYSYEISYPTKRIDSVFIPAKDMLTHSNGLLAMAKKYKDMPFDKTLLDIIEKSQQWKLNKIPEIAQKVIPILENIMGGTIIIENDVFYILKENGLKVEFGMEAEGIKKFGLLWQLLMNDSIAKDTILIWDEPEANINPSVIPDLVEILLELQRNGVQVFVSTHDYIFAKYFEVRRKSGDKVLFHSLYKTVDGVKCESNQNFKDLGENPIMKAFDKLLDEVYDLNFGE